MKKLTKDKAMSKKMFSVNDLAEWIAEGTKDGTKDIDVWLWYQWFRKEIKSRYKS